MSQHFLELEQLAAEFPKSEVRQRDGGRGIKLDYIDVVQTIQRLCSVLGADWDWRVLDSKVELVETGDGVAYLASERGELHIWLPGTERPVIRGGSGADVDSRDPDKAIKTADAEALKKAGHKFQIALYLWDEGKRNEIADFRKLSKGSDLKALKTAALKKADVKSPEALLGAMSFNLGRDLTEADLQRPEVLLEYLNVAELVAA